MFEIRRVKNQTIRINNRFKYNWLNPVDIAVLLELVEVVKDKFDKIGTKDVYPLKHQCAGLKKAFVYAFGWKDIGLFKRTAIHINNIALISDSLIKDPEKAIGEYGDIITIKANISESLRNLIDSLDVMIDSLKKKKVVAKAA